MLLDERREENRGPFRFSIRWKSDDDADASFIGEWCHRWSDVTYPMYWRRESVIFLEGPTERKLSDTDAARLEELDDMVGEAMTKEELAEFRRLSDLAEECVMIGYDSNGAPEEYEEERVRDAGYWDRAAYITDLGGNPTMKDFFPEPLPADVESLKPAFAMKLHQYADQLEGLADGSWWFVGCVVTMYLGEEELSSNSLWGIECNCGDAYQKEVEEDLIYQCLYDVSKDGGLVSRAAALRSLADEIETAAQSARSLIAKDNVAG